MQSFDSLANRNWSDVVKSTVPCTTSNLSAEPILWRSILRIRTLLILCCYWRLIRMLGSDPNMKELKHWQTKIISSPHYFPLWDSIHYLLFYTVDKIQPTGSNSLVRYFSNGSQK